MKTLNIALAAVFAAAAFAGQAQAGPNCNKGGPRYSAPSVASKPIAAPRQAVAAKPVAQRIAQASTAAQATPPAPAAIQNAKAEPKVDVQASAASAQVEVAPDVPSIAGIAARLAAQSAQQRISSAIE